MINLIIEEYCENCPCFEVEQKTIAEKNVKGELVNTEHYIKCANSHKCYNIKKFLQKEGGNNESGFNKRK